VKNTAYAWRHAIYFLSFMDGEAQRELVLEHAAAAEETRLEPAFAGLRAVIDGARFDASGHVARGAGRRFLGWSVGPTGCSRPELRSAPLVRRRTQRTAARPAYGDGSRTSAPECRSGLDDRGRTDRRLGFGAAGDGGGRGDDGGRRRVGARGAFGARRR